MSDENIARIGYMGKNDKYEIYVCTDDEHCKPHFHIRDVLTKGVNIEVCVCLERGTYLFHKRKGYNTSRYDILDHVERKMLLEFMKQPCRSPKYRNNYEFAVEMWNLNNSDTYVQIRENELGEIIMPDYSTILPYN